MFIVASLHVLFVSMSHLRTTLTFVWFFLSLFVIAYCSGTRSISCKNRSTLSVPLCKNGDLIISAMFPITVEGNVTRTGKQQCTFFRPGIILFEAFRYAVDKVNNESILKGMTLGYDAFSTCSRVDESVKIALKVHESVENNSKRNTSKYIAVIGAGKSELSITVNDILGAFDIPQVGYASSSKILSDKYRFSTFSRTIPTDTLQAKVIARILKQLGWTYAMLVYTDDNYGRPLYSSLLSYSKMNGICFADISKLLNPVTDEKLADVVKKLRNHNTARVVVMFLNGINSKRLIKMARSSNMSRKIWIFTATWYNVPEIFDAENAEFLDGSIGVVDEIIHVPNFYSYFTARLTTWEHYLGRKVLDTNDEETTMNGNIKHDLTSQFRFLTHVPYVINAVLAVVNAINKFCTERFANSTRECQKKIKANSILPYLRNTNFRGINNQQVFLDKNGDTINNNIDLYSFQTSKSENTRVPQHVLVGVYNGTEDNLTLFSNTFNWSGGKVPLSRCSTQCSKGLYKVVSVIMPCCWECTKCPLGTFSNETNSVNCRTCSSGKKPNHNQTGCEMISYDYMRWNDPWAVVVLFSAVTSSLTAFIFFLIFCYFRTTPVVRAFDCEFSLLLLLSIAVGLALPIMYPGEPSNFRCRLQDVLPAVIYSLTLSIIIAKTKRTAIIFNSKSAANIQNVLVRRSVQFTLVLLLTSTQLIVCLLWLSSRSPFVKERTLHDTRHLVCDFNSLVYFLLSKSILLSLNTWCIAIALKSRKIPCSYSNSKHTLFALLTFKLTWLMGIVGRFYGEYGSTVDSLTILISYSFLLHLMFSSKIYVLLFRKDLNNQRVLRERTWEFTLRKQSTSLSSLQLSTSMLDMKFLKRESVALSDVVKHDKGVQTDMCLGTVDILVHDA